MITPAQLKVIAPQCRKDLVSICDSLNAAIIEFGIEGKLEECAFVAQLAHESDQFNADEEYASGAAYEGRKDLGNVHPGDGKRFKGRGWIMLTGRDNYRAAGDALGVDFESYPHLASSPSNRARIAGWFWTSKGCSEPAKEGDFRRVTRIINGGYRHLDERIAFYKTALNVFDNVAPVEERSRESKSMPIPAIASILIPELIKAVPDLFNAFKGDPKKPVAERNVEAAVKVLEMAKNVTGAVNEQDAVEKITNDPEMRSLMAQQVRDNWFAIAPPDREMVEDARKMNERIAAKGYIKHNPAFWLTLAMLPLIYGASWMVLGTERFDQQIQIFVIGAIFGTVLGGVMTYWFGSSHGSQKKDDKPSAA